MIKMDYPYEASDEASESELLDKSLSMWKGWSTLEGDPSFRPTPLDLHTASSIGLYDCVNAYIAGGEVDMNQRNRGSWTPLMYASYIGHDNIVNLLLDAGAKVELRNNKGATALMLTCSCGNESVAYFLVQQGADLENRDSKGWTALFYATYAGHQKVVQFLLDNGANINTREPRLGLTPFMMAAAEGHEIIVNSLLERGVDFNLTNQNGETARSLALMNGHMKIIGLIDSCGMSPSSLRSEAGLHLSIDLSSSDESYQRPNRPHTRSGRSKVKGPSIRDGPETLAKLLSERKGARQGTVVPNTASPWLGSFPPVEPANEDDDPAFCQTGNLTIKSSNSSNSSSGGGGFAAALALSRGGSHSSIDDPSSEASSFSLPQTPNSNSSENAVFAGALNDQLSQMISADLSRRGYGVDSQFLPQSGGLAAQNHGIPTLSGSLNLSLSNSGQAHPAAAIDQYSNNVGYHSSVPPLSGDLTQDAPLDTPGDTKQHSYPHNDLEHLLESLGLRTKYFHIFEEQDVDLRVFLTLTDSDLKEVGIKLMGPRRKMTNAIARWHSQARPFSDNLEQVYADRVETAMQEMAIQLQEAIVKKGEAEAQVMQEKELRSVVEGCLVEDRKTYQQLLSLVSDARKLCHNMRQLYDSVRSCQSELIRRLQSSPLFMPKDVRFDNLSQQFSSQLQLDLSQGRPVDNTSLPPQPDENPLVSAITSSLITGDTLKGTGQQTNQSAGFMSSGGISLGGSGSHLHLQGGEGEEFVKMTMKDLLGMLSQCSHQLGRAVAMATNNMDQLIDGQTVTFSPNSSGNSLP
ncbi:ankyrin repeat and SAM domain-containing protein 3-like [Asterias amurensis]|uniref:ankyrin repeat and SAM domain-containing protein 3-like n=1 Tax=Asterias amurensis TaxID=7602 RepID=UPI003AB62259